MYFALFLIVFVSSSKKCQFASFEGGSLKGYLGQVVFSKSCFTKLRSEQSRQGKSKTKLPPKTVDDSLLNLEMAVSKKERHDDPKITNFLGGVSSPLFSGGGGILTPKVCVYLSFHVRKPMKTMTKP